MKRIISIIIVLCLMFCINSCGFLKDTADKTPDNVKIRIGYLSGPTGMGMAKMILDNNGLSNGNDKYIFTKYVDTNAAKADLAAGKIDIICLPTNEAAIYFNTVDKNSKVLAVNCLNSLYLLTSGDDTVKSLSDLNGKTVYTCKNGTPRIILQHIIDSLDLDIKVSYEIDGKEIVTPQDLSTCVVLGSIPNAVMPEPVVTSTLLTIGKNDTPHIKYTVDINLADEWSKFSSTPIAMGCIIADGDLVTSHGEAVNAFLDEYKSSVEFIGDIQNIDSAADYIVKTGIMGATPAAKKALSNLNGSISYVDGDAMKTTLVTFFDSIGIDHPDEFFYYEK